MATPLKALAWKGLGAYPNYVSPSADKETMNPTEQWSNDDTSLRAKGGYITRIAQGICTDVANDYEEHIVSQVHI